MQAVSHVRLQMTVDNLETISRLFDFVIVTSLKKQK